MSEKRKLAVVIGRFQPLHLGHVEMIRKAQELAEDVLVIIGSAYQARTIKNPFDVTERAQMISDTFPSVKINAIRDYMYDDAIWEAEIQKIVSAYEHKDSVVLVGHNKDSSSSYLKRFPQWAFHNIEAIHNIDATMIRSCLLDEGSDLAMKQQYIKKFTPKATTDRIEFFVRTAEYKTLCEEMTSIQNYKKLWEPAPYKPTFVTVDAVVTCAGHILLVKRKASPGKGLLALPGGFLDQDETIHNGIIRELVEETNIGLGWNLLRGNIKDVKVFDHPQRSLRGRTITHAGLIPLLFNKLPDILGSDDAEKAFWIPLGDIETLSGMLFEDHYSIIKSMTGV